MSMTCKENDSSKSNSDIHVTVNRFKWSVIRKDPRT